MRAFLLFLSLSLLSGAAAAQEPPAADYLTGFVLPEGLPFSEAVRVGDVLYLSGQIGVRPRTLELVAGGIEPEARQTMDNIRTVLRAAGSSLGHVIKCTVFLADMTEWAAFNEVYQSYFEAPYPARSALGANGLALGARVEVECIARAATPASGADD